MSHPAAGGHDLRDPLSRLRVMSRGGGGHRLRIVSTACPPEPTGIRRVRDQQQHSANEQNNPFHFIDSICGEQNQKNRCWKWRDYMTVSLCRMLPGAARNILMRAANMVTAPIASCSALSQIMLPPQSGAAWKQDNGKPDRGPLGWDWLCGYWHAVDRASVARSVGETASRPQPVKAAHPCGDLQATAMSREWPACFQLGTTS
jgi:hypothetical protein